MLTAKICQSIFQKTILSHWNLGKFIFPKVTFSFADYTMYFTLNFMLYHTFLSFLY